MSPALFALVVVLMVAGLGSLWAYENAVGVIKREDRLLPPDPSTVSFKALLREEWRASIQIVDEAYEQLARRTSESIHQ